MFSLSRSAVLSVSLASLTLGAACSSTGCGGRLAAPEQLSPVGDIAFYARRAVGAVNELQKFAIEGEAAGSVKTDDARAVVEATKIANVAGVDLSKALAAGVEGTTAKDQAVKTIREALTNLPGRINNPETKKLVQSYVTVTLTFLTVFA